MYSSCYDNIPMSVYSCSFQYIIIFAQERPNGLCYVHLVDEDSAIEAMRSLYKTKMGLRHIQMTRVRYFYIIIIIVLIFQHSNYEAKYYIDKYAFKDFSSDLTEGMRNLTSYTIIRARGLPFNVKIADILDFFADFNVSTYLVSFL